MATSRRRKRATDSRTPTMPGQPRDRRARTRYSSATAVAAEALRTGIVPAVRRSRRGAGIAREDQAILVGDPDDRSLANEYVGEDTPGGTSPTPDQNSVDDIGRVYGLQEEDAGPLRSAAEVLDRRDRRRSELKPPRRRL